MSSTILTDQAAMSLQCKEDSDNCLLCLQALNDPDSLRCGHTFCSQCLANYIANYPSMTVDLTPDTDSPPQMRCPTCLQLSEATEELLPNGAIPNKVQHNRKISRPSSTSPVLHACDVCSYSSRMVSTEVHCNKCSLNLCGECKAIHGNHILFKAHPVVHIANKASVSIYCEAHNNLQSLYFCDQCQHTCCAVCILQEHSGHDSSTLIDVLSLRREMLKSHLDMMGPQLDKIEFQLKTLNKIANGKPSANNQHDARSASENANHLNWNMGSQSDACSKDALDTSDETSHLLPQIQFMLKDENENTPGGLLQRKRKSFSQGPKTIANMILSPVEKGRMSFLGNLRNKKMPEEKSPVELRINRGLQVNNRHPEDACQSLETSSPQFKLRASRHSSSSSRSSVSSGKSPASPQWHQFTRMEKMSPVLQKRKLSLSQFIPHPATQLQSAAQHGGLTLPDTQLFVPVDRLLVGKYEGQLQLIRKFYNHAAKTVSTKRFLKTFNELDQRMMSAMNVEVKQLKWRVDDMMDKHEASLQSLAMMPSSSFNSMDMTVTSAHRKNSRPSFGDIKNQRGVDDELHRPLSMLIKPKLLWKTEKHKSDPGDLWNRCGIAFLPNGNTVVAEYDMNNPKNNRIHIYDTEGQTVSMICEEQMCPLGVAVTPEGYIAVTDCKSKRVKVVTVTGQPVCEWGKGHFGWPHGLAINSKGQFVVSDAFNDFVSIHHPDGKLIRQIGCSGSATNCFRNPFHIAVDHNDNIIVSDCGNNCIKVFNPNGRFLFSNRGVSVTSLESFDPNNKSRRLNGPRGVAVDLKGNILVADDNNRIVMFDRCGKYIRNLLTEEQQVKFVEGMAVNKDGLLALTECNPSQMFSVKAFSLYDSSSG